MSDEQKRKRFWTIIIAGVVVWIVIVPVVAAAVLAFVRYRHESAKPSTKPVPNLIGLDPQSGEIKARDAGFSMNVMGKDWDLPDAPCTVGTITKQEPHPGESVAFQQIGVVTCIEDPDKKFGKSRENAYHGHRSLNN
jgi:beta-lactam-binding protein with PASTA domain